MIKDNIKGLLLGIFIVIALLVCCMAIDSADENITVDQSMVNDTNTTVVGGVHYDEKLVKHNSTGIAKVHRIVHIKPHYPVITMTGKPSCSRCARNHCSYTWRTKTYVNYCPHCHHWNCLGNKHKSGSVHEQEISCFRCDSDFCINCGKTKYSWSNVYLRRA